MTNESRCIVCGRPLRSHNAIVRGMGSECAKKYAQMQASESVGIALYPLQTGDIPVDYSYLNTDHHQIQQVVFNADDRKMKVQFIEDNYPCDLDLENDQHEREVIYTLEPKNIEPSRFTESSYEGTALKESYPFVSPITEDFKAETRVEGLSETEVKLLTGLLKYEKHHEFAFAMLRTKNMDTCECLDEELSKRYKIYKSQNPSAPEVMTRQYASMMYEELRENFLKQQPDNIRRLQSHLLVEKAKIAQQYEMEKVQRLSNFGIESFMGASRVIDTQTMKVPDNAPREQYEKIIQSALSPQSGNVNLKGMGGRQAQRVANVIYQLSQRYQPAFQYCTKFGTFDSFADLVANDYNAEVVESGKEELAKEEFRESMGGFYLGIEDEGQKELPISERSKYVGIFINPDMKDKGLSNSYSNIIRTEKTVEYQDYVVVHESGHLIHDTCDHETKQKIHAIFEREKNTIPQQLSIYGATDSEEMVAEAFADYTLNDNPKPISREIMGLVENSWKRSTDYQHVSSRMAKRITEVTIESHEDYREVNESLNKLKRGVF